MVRRSAWSGIGKTVSSSARGDRSGSRRAGGDAEMSSATITASNGKTERRPGSIATSATVAGSCTAFSTEHLMPELPFSKLYVPAPLRVSPPVTDPSVRYVELHCKTNFSFLEGASHPDELVAQAARLGYAGMAVTDRNSLAGVVRAHVAAKEAGLKLIVGAEITLDDAGPVLLWAMNRQGYGRLCQLLTRGRRQAPKGECRLAFADVAEHASGLLLGVLLSHADRSGVGVASVA